MGSVLEYFRVIVVIIVAVLVSIKRTIIINQPTKHHQSINISLKGLVGVSP
jgi:hypothetical protein